jgi:hypothetical protein
MGDIRVLSARYADGIPGFSLKNRNMTDSSSGYLHDLYAKSFQGIGSHIHLTHCQSHILKRRIFNTSWHDGMNCYPIFCCRNWDKLHLDINSLGNELVSVFLITDPFGTFEQKYLKEIFNDVLYPYKHHFTIDLHVPKEKIISHHHQRKLKKLNKKIKITISEKSEENDLNNWTELYENLIARHKISGFLTFSREIFRAQLKVPGLVLARAILDDELIGMLLWYMMGDFAYYHLGAFSPRGYSEHVSYKLFESSLDFFLTKHLGNVDLGGAAGLNQEESDGLSRFKKGWSTGTRIVYFCGKIFQYDVYNKLSVNANFSDKSYFPSYRKGEFK